MINAMGMIIMEKNKFLMINDLIYEIYLWNNVSDIDDSFFQRLKMIVPFEYASLFLHDESADNPFSLGEPICFPSSFQEAELKYAQFAGEDELLWILHGKESQLIRESAVLDDEHRLNSSLYRKCYRKYNIYDSLQCTIVFQQKFLGVLTLFRTRPNGTFVSDDMFYLRAIAMHLNPILHRILFPKSSGYSHRTDEMHDLAQLSSCHLTSRETEILKCLLDFQDNEEIAETLHIKETTLNKHLQNLFRKLEVRSRWELLRKLKL